MLILTAQKICTLLSYSLLAAM